MRKKFLLVILLSGFLVACGGNKSAETVTEPEVSEADSIESESVKTIQTVDEVVDEDAEKQEDSVESNDNEQVEETIAERVTFADFINGTGNASVAENFLWEGNMIEYSVKSGETYDLKKLKEFLGQNEFTQGAEPEITYASVKIHDQELFALKFYYLSEREEVTNLFIMKETEDKLEFIFGIDGWSRKQVAVNEYGIISVFGSSGAANAGYDLYAPDKAFEYHAVYNKNEDYYDFYLEDDIVDAAPDTLRSIMKEAGQGNEKAKETVYYTEIINGKTYYYFLGTGKMSQSTVDYIDKVAAKYDFKFDGKAAADDARDAYIKELGIEELIDNENEPQWKGV